MNDSFLYWDRARQTNVPHHEKIQPLLDAFEAYRRQVAAKIIGGLIEELRVHYDYKPELPFQTASVMQANSFGSLSTRELLQTRHEDGVLATVIWTSAKGLEAVNTEESEPISIVFPRDRVLIMPGGIMTLMTGGEIPPYYHQARNHGDQTRKSIMYFANPDIHRDPITPFVVNDFNKGKDVREEIQTATEMFGLFDFVPS